MSSHGVNDWIAGLRRRATVRAASWVAPLYAVSFALLARSWPLPYPNGERFAGLIALVLLAALAASGGRRKLAAAGLGLIPVVLIGVAPEQPALRAAILPLGMLPLLASGCLHRWLAQRLEALVLGSTLACAWLAAASLPWLGGRLLAVSAAVSPLGLLSGGRVDPESLLLPVFFLVAATFAVDARRGGPRRSLGRFLVALLGLFAMQLVHRHPGIGGGCIALLLLCWCRKSRRDPAVTGAGIGRAPLYGVWCGAVAALLIAGVSRVVDDSAVRGTVAFLSSASLSLEPPATAGESAGLSFGMWRAYLDASGLGTKVLAAPLRSEDLDDVGALVLINHNRTLPAAEALAVHRFVERGGTLLVLADHTDVMRQIGPTNELIGRYGITLRFDTAVPMDRPWDWRGAMHAMLHPMTLGVSDVRQYAWGLGCSLELDGRAVPILVGARAFSDDGNAKDAARAGLGDLALGRQERREGVVLAAEARGGAGRVIVLGDTSAFQDSCLPRAFPFVARTSRYALGRNRPELGVGVAVMLAAAVALGLTLCLRRPVQNGGSALWTSTGLCLGVVAGLGAVLDANDVDLLPSAKRVVWIDLVHGSPASSKPQSPYALGGLHEAVARAGWLPLHARKSLAEHLADKPAALIVPAPRTPFSAAELAATERYLRAGGTVAVFAGAREFQAAPQLLARFGVTIGDVPLGEAPGASTGSGTVIDPGEAWPVLGEDCAPLATAWEHAIAVRKEVGVGLLLVIADPLLFLGDGLQQAKQINEPNQAFFDALVQDWRQDS